MDQYLSKEKSKKLWELGYGSIVENWYEDDIPKPNCYELLMALRSYKIKDATVDLIIGQDEFYVGYALPYLHYNMPGPVRGQDLIEVLGDALIAQINFIQGRGEK